MSENTMQLLTICVPSATVIIGRLWSMMEHRKTGKDVQELKLYINGDLKKKIADALEQGREEGRAEKL